ncbi:MAG: FKBP-type peptidyl-prolyl cis-trans isomerase [Bacteroidales bacterium]|nr:FKBP-type peptidyl-prolyl cis-trans isomerase [Bacteroidales bacterium]
MNTGLSVCLLIFLALASCSNRKEAGNINTRPGKSEMAELNRYLVQKDRERIENYIERKNLKMEVTSTGLWYYIMRAGEGNLFGDNDRVVFDYECTLLDGTFCYSSKESGPRDVILGRAELEAGLNEGLRMLRPGAGALFIMPPYLAFGLPGDGKKIPPRSVIVYEVSVLPGK